MNRIITGLLLSVCCVANAGASNIIRTTAPVVFSDSSQDNWVSTDPLVSEWVGAGDVGNCTSWLPSPSTVQNGVVFDQTGTGCEQSQTRTIQAREVNTRNGAFRSVGGPNIETRVLTGLTASRTSTGELVVTSAKYFRIYIEQNQSNSSYSRLVEIELLDSLNNDLFDLHSVISSESSYYGVQFRADKAIDNHFGDRWTSSSYGQNSWVAYEFPQEVSPVKFTIRDYPTSAGNDQQPKNFRVEKSNDGINWVVIKRFENETNWKGGEYRIYDLM